MIFLGRRPTPRQRVLLVLAVVMAIVGVDCLATAGATVVRPESAARDQSLEGDLMVAHGDNFTTGAMVMQTELRTATGVVPLAVPAAEHAATLALAGERVRVRGTRDARSFAVLSVASSPAARGALAHPQVSPRAQHTMRIAVVLMRLPGSSAEPVTTASVRASTFGARNSVASWFAEGSGGQVTVTGTVYGYYNGVKTCDLAKQLAAGAAAAKKSGFVASDYDHLVVYTPPQPCDFGGIGWVGQNGVFLNGETAPGLMEHELGHNLGLWHAGEYACASTKLAATCLTVYGDDTDVMGNPYANHGYNAEHKYTLGWIPSSEVRTITSGTQTIALTASEKPVVAGAIELIRIRAADGARYAVDRRASVGYDTGLSGVWIRKLASVGTDDTELLRGSALAAGSAFVDPLHHVTIATLTDSGPTASVRVCVGPCPATH